MNERSAHKEYEFAIVVMIQSTSIKVAFGTERVKSDFFCKDSLMRHVEVDNKLPKTIPGNGKFKEEWNEKYRDWLGQKNRSMVIAR